MYSHNKRSWFSPIHPFRFPSGIFQYTNMESHPATTVSLAQLAEVFNDSFADYSGGPVNFNADTLAEWISNNFISLPRSHVLLSRDDSSKPIAFGFIALRDDKPGESRIPMLGVVPSARGGTGSRLVEQMIRGEKANGVKVIWLECLQDHALAVNLYRRKGFTIHQELPGWQRDALLPHELVSDPDLQVCTVEEIDALVKQYGAKDLPWQAWGFRLRCGPSGGQAFRLGHAYCVVSNPDDVDEEIVVHSLILPPEWRGKGEATRLAKAVMSTFPGKKWQVYPLFPKEYTEAIAKKLGFKQDEIQYQMKLSLD